MSDVQLDEDCLRRVLPAATDLAASDVEVIGQIALLTAEIDFNEEADERSLLNVLNRSMWRLIDAPPRPITPVSPLPIDREERIGWLRKLVPRLSQTTPHARELAYATAYLVVVIDRELAPVESELLRELQRALGLDDERAEEIAEVASRAVTPGEEPDVSSVDRI